MGAVVLYLVLHNLAGEPQDSFGVNARPEDKRHRFVRVYRFYRGAAVLIRIRERIGSEKNASSD